MINKNIKNKQKDVLEFTCKPVKKVHSSDNYKIYAVEADVNEFPFIELNQYGNTTITGNFHELGLGIQYKVKATSEQTKYGLSYKILNIKRDRPTTVESTREFLNEILTPAQTSEILKSYPDIVSKVMNDDLGDIDLKKLHNIGEYRFNIIKEKIIDNFALVELVEQFQGAISLPMIKALYVKYPSIEKIRIELKKEPYKCLCGINRVGFKTADSILAEIEKISAENVKNGKEPIIDFGYDLLISPQRCKACIMYLLEENETQGNTYLGIKELKEQSDKLAPACKEHFVDVLKSDTDIHFDKGVMGVSLQHTYEMEKYIADRIKDANTLVMGEYAEKALNPDYKHKLIWDIDYSKYVAQFGLTEEQGKALEFMCKYNLFILNGFGGSGKSFTSSAVIQMLIENKKQITLLAPTGRASKILAEYAKYPASTIHRGLAYMPPNWGFNENNKLSCDVLIMDETSMTDVNLMEKIFKAVDLSRTKLMFIGDSAQLPSVGAGNVLHDLITSELVPIATLTKIFRYGVGGVLTVATKIRNQERFITDNKKPTVIGEDRGYIFFPTEQNLVLARVKQLYKKLIEDGKKPEDIMVLSSYNKGEYGTIALNNLLQPIANQNYGSKNKFEVGDTIFYIGDLIMQTVNNYKANIYNEDSKDDTGLQTFIPNGELGIVEDINMFQEKMIELFDHDKIVYTKSEANMLKLAYSIGIHKSQGGSADTVIMITPKAHTYMLNSNIMYVAVTRARSQCYHFGEIDTVNLALTKKENYNRKTLLKHFLVNDRK